MNDTPWQQSITTHRAQQAAHISQTALAMAIDKGVTALTMSSIADAAGISRQTLYKYYPDVEAVLSAAVAAASEIDRHLTDRVQSVADPVKRLGLLVGLVIEAGSEGHMAPVGLEAALPPDARAGLERHATTMTNLFADTIAAGIDDGRFEAVDVSLTGKLVIGAVLAAADHASTHADELEVITEITVQMALKMVGARS